jgi:hypothetical protein
MLLVHVLANLSKKKSSAQKPVPQVPMDPVPQALLETLPVTLPEPIKSDKKSLSSHPLKDLEEFIEERNISYKPGSSAAQKRSMAGTPASTAGASSSFEDSIDSINSISSTAGSADARDALARMQAGSSNMVSIKSGSRLRFDPWSLANNLTGTAGLINISYKPGSNRANKPSSPSRPSCVCGSGSVFAGGSKTELLAGLTAMDGCSTSLSRTSSGFGAAALISSDSSSSLAGGCLVGSDRGSSSSSGGGSNGGKAPISNQKYYGFGLSRTSSFGSQIMNGFNSFGVPALQLPTQASGGAAGAVDSPRGAGKDQQKARCVYEKGTSSKAALLLAASLPVAGNSSGSISARVGGAEVQPLMSVLGCGLGASSVKGVVNSTGNGNISGSFGSSFGRLYSTVLLLLAVCLLYCVVCAAASPVQPVATAVLAASVAATLMPAAKDAAAACGAAAVKG